MKALCTMMLTKITGTNRPVNKFISTAIQDTNYKAYKKINNYFSL